jgi:hypothetical protein
MLRYKLLMGYLFLIADTEVHVDNIFSAFAFLSRDNMITRQLDTDVVGVF